MQSMAYKSGWLRGTQHALLCGPARAHKHQHSDICSPQVMHICKGAPKDRNVPEQSVMVAGPLMPATSLLLEQELDVTKLEIRSVKDLKTARRSTQTLANGLICGCHCPPDNVSDLEPFGALVSCFRNGVEQSVLGGLERCFSFFSSPNTGYWNHIDLVNRALPGNTPPPPKKNSHAELRCSDGGLEGRGQQHGVKWHKEACVTKHKFSPSNQISMTTLAHF